MSSAKGEHRSKPSRSNSSSLKSSLTASSSSGFSSSADRSSAVARQSRQQTAALIIYRPSFRDYRFVIPTITLTRPEDEEDYCTQSPFPESVYLSPGYASPSNYRHLGVPSTPSGAFSRVSRKSWPHPSGPWLRGPAYSKSPPSAGTRLTSGAILGWTQVLPTPWAYPKARLSASAFNLSRPLPPLRVPTEEDLARLRWEHAHRGSSKGRKI